MIANWAGNVRFQPRRLHRPRSMDELRQALDGHDRVRAVGAAHSFNRVADTEGVLIDLAEMPRGLDIDTARRRARVSDGWTYGELCPRLHAAGWALENLAPCRISACPAPARPPRTAPDGDSAALRRRSTRSSCSPRTQSW